MAATDYVETEDFFDTIRAYSEAVLSVPVYRWSGLIRSGLASHFGGQATKKALTDPKGFVTMGFSSLTNDERTGWGGLGRSQYPIAFTPVIPSQGKYLAEVARMNALFDKITRELFHSDNLGGTALEPLMGGMDLGNVRLVILEEDLHLRSATWILTSVYR